MSDYPGDVWGDWSPALCAAIEATAARGDGGLDVANVDGQPLIRHASPVILIDDYVLGAMRAGFWRPTQWITYVRDGRELCDNEVPVQVRVSGTNGSWVYRLRGTYRLGEAVAAWRSPPWAPPRRELVYVYAWPD